MAEVVCNLCSCRLEWNDVDSEELMCRSCGHSLDDDHVAAPASPSLHPEPSIAIFVGRKVI